MSSSLRNSLIGGGLLVAGFTVQNASIVYWTAAPISPFGILLYANLFFTSFFGLLLVIFAAVTRDKSALLVADSPIQRSLFTLTKRGATLAQLAALVGLLNIANGFLIVYASPPDRTPPLIQAVLQNSGVLFAVPASKLVLGDRKAYCARAPLAAGALVAASIGVSVLPTVLAGVGGEFSGGAARWAWIAIYLIGIAPGAAYNVVQQLFLIRAGALAPGASRLTVARSSLRALFYCNLAQLLWLLALWWVDVLPWFGASAHVADFSNNTRFSLRCSLGLEDCGLAQFGVVPAVWAGAFAAGYCVSYIGSVLLNRESAAFNMLAAVITTALTSLYFLLPGTNPASSTTPLWSVLSALVLSLSGLVLWKRWEASTPADEQFAVAEAADDVSLGLSLTASAGGEGEIGGDFYEAPKATGGRVPLLGEWR